ncbi:hypothetical protein F7725_014906 [Dissostichus mawsoni]|uniref:Uncharacterized protein n=1 Tax=Dissostichus mawsoni TaxID=36200 RepID=A0A7J5YI26_DISMA|nr:hypothetical protein F7725_014906 [Dissostichus mawsoni]
MASTTACTKAVPLVYPQEVQNDSARKAYKLKLLKERPETLFANLYKSFSNLAAAGQRESHGTADRSDRGGEGAERERRSYRRELTALSEELQERERVKEQLDSHPDHNQNPVTPIESSQNPPTQQPPSTPSSISSPHANPTPRSPPITQMNTTLAHRLTPPLILPDQHSREGSQTSLSSSTPMANSLMKINFSPPTQWLKSERHPTGPPPRQHPWRQDHPHLLPHHAPLRSHQGSYDYPQARPEPLLSPGVPPQPQRRELHPDPLSYAQAVKRTAGPTLTTTTHVPEPTHTPPHDELRDIQQMLSLLCSHLIGQVPQ